MHGSIGKYCSATATATNDRLLAFLAKAHPISCNSLREVGWAFLFSLRLQVNLQSLNSSTRMNLQGEN